MVSCFRTEEDMKLKFLVMNNTYCEQAKQAKQAKQATCNVTDIDCTCSVGCDRELKKQVCKTLILLHKAAVKRHFILVKKAPLYGRDQWLKTCILSFEK
jgi:hypothetical protein